MKSPIHLIMAMAMVTEPNIHQHHCTRTIINHIADGVSDEPWVTTPPNPTEAKLTIVHITDVYTLKNFASLKTMIQQTKERQQQKTLSSSKCNDDNHHNNVISILTGDFLAPYLLSTVDHGYGMMKALAQTPIDYLMFRNHEADMDHDIVCHRIKNFPGTFINTNMQDHDAMAY